MNYRVEGVSCREAEEKRGKGRNSPELFMLVFSNPMFGKCHASHIRVTSVWRAWCEVLVLPGILASRYSLLAMSDNTNAAAARPAVGAAPARADEGPWAQVWPTIQKVLVFWLIRWVFRVTYLHFILKVT